MKAASIANASQWVLAMMLGFVSSVIVVFALMAFLSSMRDEQENFTREGFVGFLIDVGLSGFRPFEWIVALLFLGGSLSVFAGCCFWVFTLDRRSALAR